MKKILKKKFIFLLFISTACSQNFNTSKFDKQTPKYKICFKDANHSIEKNININQDRIDMLQSDDTMIDLYNIENDIEEIKFSKKRTNMIEDCMKSK